MVRNAGTRSLEALAGVHKNDVASVDHKSSSVHLPTGLEPSWLCLCCSWRSEAEEPKLALVLTSLGRSEEGTARTIAELSPPCFTEFCAFVFSEHCRLRSRLSPGRDVPAQAAITPGWSAGTHRLGNTTFPLHLCRVISVSNVTPGAGALCIIK